MLDPHELEGQVPELHPPASGWGLSLTPTGGSFDGGPTGVEKDGFEPTAY